MSEWAYRECEKCGKRVHINSTCKKWGSSKNNCDGDPWGVVDSAKKKLIKLEEMKDTHLKVLKDIELAINQTNEIIQLS